MLYFSHIIKALKWSIPVATAYIPLGFALGVFMVSSGIDWYWAPLTALFIFAGSIEFLIVSFIESGQSFVAIASTTLIINFRHIFYGLSFPLDRMTSWVQRTYGIFALTDETYSILSANQQTPLNGLEISLLQIISHGWWVGACFCGALFATALPPEVTGFEFALTAMFIALAMDTIRHMKEGILLLYALVSSVIGVLMETFVLNGSFLATGLLCYVVLISKDYRTKSMEVA